MTCQLKFVYNKRVTLGVTPRVVNPRRSRVETSLGGFLFSRSRCSYFTSHLFPVLRYRLTNEGEFITRACLLLRHRAVPPSVIPQSCQLPRCQQIILIFMQVTRCSVQSYPGTQIDTLSNSMSYATRRFHAAFTRTLQ